MKLAFSLITTLKINAGLNLIMKLALKVFEFELDFRFLNVKGTLYVLLYAGSFSLVVIYV